METALFEKIKEELQNITIDKLRYFSDICGWWGFVGDNISVRITRPAANTKKNALLFLCSKKFLNYLKECTNKKGDFIQTILSNKKVFFITVSESNFAITHNITDIHI